MVLKGVYFKGLKN